MAKLKKISTEQKTGCSSLLTGFFQSWSPRRRKPSLPENLPESANFSSKHQQSAGNPKNPNGESIDSSLPENPNSPILQRKPKPKPKPETHLSRKSLDSARNSTSSVSSRNEFRKFGEDGVLGNIIVKQASEEPKQRNFQTDTLMINKRLDSEMLKKLGNEAYSKGRFQEALVFYDKAISIDPKKAMYWCNKSAALISLGRLLEAFDVCNEALRLDPNYERAHQRLAKLYIRLGDPDKALRHFKQAGKYSETKDIEQAEDLRPCLARCNNAQKSAEWDVLLKETNLAISSGADSAPRVYALQADALLHLLRHEEAYLAYQKATNFSIDSCIKLFGLHVTSYLLMIGSLVYLAAGRFEDAVTASRQAARLDPSSEAANRAVQTARAIASARLSGNLLFKASKFNLASQVYTEGLEQNQHNALLLCNRAACRYKLGQFEKAIEDCTKALNLQPSYAKARRRRADCNAKMEKWEAAIRDYELLMKEIPGDKEIGRALFETKIRQREQTGEDFRNGETGSDLVLINKNEKKLGNNYGKMYRH